MVTSVNQQIFEWQQKMQQLMQNLQQAQTPSAIPVAASPAHVESKITNQNPHTHAESNHFSDKKSGAQQDDAVSAREALIAKARAFRESQEKKPEQLVMNVEPSESGQTNQQMLEVPAFIRKRQLLQEN
jgi:hypothetical protein